MSIRSSRKPRYAVHFRIPEGPDPSESLFAAGVEAWKKYEETRGSQYLAEAVRNHQEALDIRVSGHPHRSKSLFHTATALLEHCQDAVTKENCLTVIAYYDEALRLLPDKPDKHRLRAAVYANLGTVYFTLFCLEKEDLEAFPATGSNIDKAIKSYRSALQLRPAGDDPNLPSILINLSIALIQKDGKDDFKDAIFYLRKAAELCNMTHADHPLLLSVLSDLVKAYDHHYYYSDDISNVVEGIDVLRMLVNLTNEGKEGLISLVNRENGGCWRLYEIKHNRGNDLNRALRRGREVLKLSDGSDKIIHGKVLIALARVLSARYFQTGRMNVTDLDESIQYYREAIDPDLEDGPDPVLCSSLAFAIHTRCQDFEEEVEGATLWDAISYNQEALHTCPKDDPLYLKIQNNLGSIYLTQFDKWGAEGDLVKGIQAYEDVVSHCPDDNDGFTYYQETLKDAKRALQDKRKDKRKRRKSTKSKLRRRRSVAASGRSGQSSDESCPSRPASIN